ncbi:MAG: cupin-like domain-containing protein [Hydrogenophaga sp.]|uniref:cupin-like domain-containing protein n=1 Tax=Hydrogenophaga sp. TaxID=1904254 RepID=UPI0026149129|nr:cupin-like domain-containing protein [Hydrogenophaga sp.]MCW5672393.1 cupin-like domain-containing protein [Hydrogenophaga sp.]
MLTCFSEGVSAAKLDREPFKFRHRLVGHPALEMGNLARVIPALPKDQVMYAIRPLQNGDDFETTFRQRPEEQSIEATIENLRVSDSYIMVSSPQVEASFAGLYKDLIGDVEALMRERGVGTTAITPKLYLFIASPNSVTPFHIDRYSTFLMQFRGSKQVTVSQPWDDRVVSVRDCENYVSYVNTRLPWSPEKDAYATAYEFNPGEALHIPFVAGHHVRNGPQDISISMSIIFNTRQTMAWRNALNFNQRARKVLRRVGLAPAPVGHRPLSDGAKARCWTAWARLRYH